MKINLNGKIYDDLTELSKESGLSEETLSKRLAQYGSNAAKVLAPVHTSNKEITIGDKTFPSYEAAGRYYEIPGQVIRHRMQAGITKPEKIISKKHYKHDDWPKDGIAIGDKTYPNINQASVALGVPYGTLKKRLEQGITDPKLLTEHNARGNLRKAVTIDGNRFASTQLALDYYHVSAGTYYRKLSEGLTPSQAIKASKAVKVNSADTGKKAIVVDGKNFESISAAQRYYGVKPATYYGRVQRGMTPEQALLKDAKPSVKEPAETNSSKTSVTDVNTNKINETSRNDDSKDDIFASALSTQSDDFEKAEDSILEMQHVAKLLNNTKNVTVCMKVTTTELFAIKSTLNINMQSSLTQTKKYVFDVIEDDHVLRDLTTDELEKYLKKRN